ncbi:MAG: threonine aldolase, partial [Bacillota bacterium]|nr:threonine aldolase [Bacillota bacterium]
DMVFFKVETSLSGEQLQSEFLNRGIKVNAPEKGEMRFVTHYWVTRADVEKVASAFKEILSI